MSQENLIYYIQDILPISHEKAEGIASAFQYRETPKGEFFVKEGKINNESHFVERGYVRSYIFDTEGNEVTTSIFSRDTFASDFSSFFKRTPSKEYIQALTDCKTWYIDFETVQKNFHGASPEFREFGRMLLINNSIDLKNRLLSMFQQTAEQRYADLVEHNFGIFQNVSLKILASYLGVTQTSLSRLRREYGLKSMGKIS